MDSVGRAYEVKVTELLPRTVGPRKLTQFSSYSVICDLKTKPVLEDP